MFALNTLLHQSRDLVPLPTHKAKPGVPLALLFLT